MPHVVWTAQPGPQAALIACPVFEVFFGGARGGGKTEGSIGDWLEHSSTYGIHAIGVFFRRTLKQLEEVIARTQQLFPKIGASYHTQDKVWTMPGGGRLKFRYLEKDSDAQEYQGHNYTRVYIEEVTNFPSPAPINLLRATLRSAEGVPVGLRLTGNPGGPGHNWVKQRYINPAPGGWNIIKEWVDGYGDIPGQWMERIFIPSQLRDNPRLMQHGSQYVGQLRQAGSAQLVKAWLEGDWDMIDGAFFDCYDGRLHVLDGSEWIRRIPRSATRVIALDWGYARPFSVGWYAVSDGSWDLPRDALVKYREWYGWTGMPNVGIRMDPASVAAGVALRNRENGFQERIDIAVADPAIFVRDGGPCIGEIMAIHGASFGRADNKRIPGWSELRRRLVGTNGQPMLYFLDYCTETIRTIPTLQHDETNMEDLDTDGEDHAADETRYACMSRPWTRVSEEIVVPFRPKLPSEYTINELVERQRQRRLEFEYQDA